MANISEVAKLAGVSKSTVSRVLSNSSLVAGDTKAKVEAAIKQLDYRPNPAARALKSSKASLIGVVVPTPSSAFFNPFVTGLNEELAGTGYTMMFAPGGTTAESEATAIESLLDRRCDGLILLLNHPLSDFLARRLETLPEPTVLVGHANSKTHDTLTVDNDHGGYVAMRYLLSMNHRDIVILAGGEFNPDTIERVKGYRRAVESFGLDWSNIAIEYGEYSEEYGIACAERLLKAGLPSAIMAGDDDIAAGVISTLREANIALGDTVSIIGFDDSFFARHLYPRLTTVRQPLQELGQHAGKRLLKLMRNQPVEKIAALEPTLVVRHSVGLAKD
ncbi:LacI family DNA-binding transcriptional regulator [Salinibius halmophilus]|uniref:LacI family DNA-binding transcriptional regulator n=1 Tax=Salinibius halmophilus TaxID=1853216 RepID=UPI000E671972|nr:LacI family DNA-binding transcriptional regulator [Salinibius halmophilus]